jgi:hypothetical protein
LGFFATSAFVLFIGHSYFVGVPLIALSTLLTVQTGRVRFVFDNEALELFVAEKKDDKVNEKEEILKTSRDNIVVGGRNRWTYDSFVDWFFIPSKDFPVLVYFKETQTSPDGQIHFFPVIMNGKVLYETMVEKIGILPKK